MMNTNAVACPRVLEFRAKRSSTEGASGAPRTRMIVSASA
jgi:hypothetical protein